MAKHTTPPSANGSTGVPRSPKRRESPSPNLGGTGSAPPAPGPEKARKAGAGPGAQRSPPDSAGQGACKKVQGLLMQGPASPDDGQAKVTSRKRPVSGAEFGTRPYYQRRLSALELERATWVAHWREIADYMAPRRQRQFWYDRNKGTKRNEKIINSTALVALRTLSSGMHSGLTSPARPWYRFTTPDPGLAEIPRVRSWLHLVETRMRTVHARSNLYNVLPQVYYDLGAFGTAGLWIDEDPTEVIRGYVFPINSYALGVGANQKVDSLYRRVSMPVSGVVDAFGYEQCSPQVRDLYDKGALDQWVLLCQACEPNRLHDPGDALSKAYSNVWFELETSGGPKDLLRRSGYGSFPVCAPRWNVNGEDIYGYSPGMDALGDVRALQQLERRKLATADKIVNPPFVAPAALRNQRVSLLAGDVSYLDAATPAGARFEPALVMPPLAMDVEERSILTHERRVNDAFFASLWMLLINDERAQRATAEEVRAKTDEKMLQLGPVLERLHDELLDPLIDRTFDVMLQRGLIPPPPPELQRAAENGDDELRVEYISILAQAQKLVGTAAIDRQVAFVANMAGIVGPAALDLLDVDKTVREYQGMLGTNPETMRSQEQVDQMREERAQADQARAQAEQALSTTQAAAHAGRAAKDLSQAPLNDPNGPTALTGLLGALGPAAVAGAGGPDGGVGS
jgi:hypothetical protein